MSISCIDVRGVCHSYGRRPVLHDIDLRVTSGVVGLLGPNGAGKTTLMRLIATLLPVQTGSVALEGVDVQDDLTQARRKLAYLPQRFEVLNRATVQRNVEFAAWAREVPQTEIATAAQTVIRQVGLWDQRDSRANTLSGGMRQRLGIACAVVHKPSVVLLDEPTVGLDPIQRVALRRTIDGLARDAAVLVSTHVLEDLSALASRIVVLDGGRVRFEGSMADLEQMGAATPLPGMSDAEAGYTHLIVGPSA